MNDERISDLVFRSLGGPVPDELAAGTPLLRFANTDLEAVSLLDGVLDDPVLRERRQKKCDVCPTDQPHAEISRLWMPAGTSVVEIAACWFHRDAINDSTAMTLTWV